VIVSAVVIEGVIEGVSAITVVVICEIITTPEAFHLSSTENISLIQWTFETRGHIPFTNGHVIHMAMSEFHGKSMNAIAPFTKGN
jgi:hypothetical protein